MDDPEQYDRAAEPVPDHLPDRITVFWRFRKGGAAAGTDIEMRTRIGGELRQISGVVWEDVAPYYVEETDHGPSLGVAGKVTYRRRDIGARSPEGR